MDTKQDPEGDPVSSVERHPCGCVAVSFQSGRQEVDMCVPCCLGNAGELLQKAGRRMVREQQEAQKAEEPGIIAPGGGLIVPDHIPGNRA